MWVNVEHVIAVGEHSCNSTKFVVNYAISADKCNGNAMIHIVASESECHLVTLAAAVVPYPAGKQAKVS